MVRRLSQAVETRNESVVVQDPHPTQAQAQAPREEDLILEKSETGALMGFWE